MEIDGKLEELGRILRACGKAAIAFSGGVDSSFLCAAARRELGDGAMAFTVVSPFLPASELRDAVSIAGHIGIRHVLLEIPEIGETVAANPPDRCYLCKKSYFDAVRDAAHRHGISAVLDGSNTDDEGDYRPGMRALAELGIASPLGEAGLSKAEIRELSRRFGLPTADKPAFACLASRIPYGERIDAKKLARIERAEDYLRSLGLAQVRVRSHGDLARIEVAPGERKLLFSEGLLDEISEKLSSMGFLYTALDLAGYRTGSLNASILKAGE
jgi:uncharacterized protein